jgi:hypothetical protein
MQSAPYLQGIHLHVHRVHYSSTTNILFLFTNYKLHLTANKVCNKKKRKEISIVLELALEPVAIKTVLPKQTFAVHHSMLSFHLLGSSTVDAVMFVLMYIKWLASF